MTQSPTTSSSSPTSSRAAATSPTDSRRRPPVACSVPSAWATTTGSSRRSALPAHGTRSRPATCPWTGSPRPSRMACTPSLTALASRSRDRLQGVISFHELATPICGLTQSSSPMPTARSMPRAAAFSSPSVTSRLRGLMSGWLEDVVGLWVMPGFYDPVHELKPRSRPADIATTGSASRDDELLKVCRVGRQLSPATLEPQNSEAAGGEALRKAFGGVGRPGAILSERRCQHWDPGGMPNQKDGVDRVRNLPQHVHQAGRAAVVDASVKAGVLDGSSPSTDRIEGLACSLGGRAQCQVEDARWEPSCLRRFAQPFADGTGVLASSACQLAIVIRLARHVLGLGMTQQEQRAPDRRLRHVTSISRIQGSGESATGNRRQDVDHGAGTDHEIQAAEPAYILAVDEHVDVAAQGACLIPDPSPDQRPRDEGRVQDRPQRHGLQAHRQDELTGTVGQLPQDRRQDDPHTVAHVRTATRTHRTSGSCSAMRAKLSPSSTDAYTSPLRVPK